MTETHLTQAAAQALRLIDRKAAATLVGSLAASMTRREGSPRVAMLARLVADGLAASVADAPPVPPGRAGPDASGIGWQRALDTLGRDTGPSAAATTAATRPRATTARTAPTDATRGILSGYYDTANIGRYTFSLMNGVQLQVGTPRSPGNIGGLFWLEAMPQGVWHRLDDRNHRLLKVWVRWRGHDLDVMVDAGPDGAAVVSASDQGR